MKNYRITFHNESSDKSKKYDVIAESSDDAFRMAYRMPEAKLRHIYTEIMVEEHPEGSSPIGIKFEYDDLMLKKKSAQYMIIRAENEKQAIGFYNKKYKGQKFYQPWPKEINSKGNCIYGSVKETYFAACPGWDDDATVEYVE